MTQFGSPFTGDASYGGGFTAVLGDVPDGGIIGESLESSFAPITPDGNSGVISAFVADSPVRVSVSGIQYRQVAVAQNPGEWSYNPESQSISVSLLKDILPGEMLYVQTGRQLPTYRYTASDRSKHELLDPIPREEIGGDGWDFLANDLNVSGSYTLTRSRGQHPTFNVSAEVLKTGLASFRQKISNLTKIYYFFGIPFYLTTPTETEEPDTNYITFNLTFIGKHTPRAQYSPLDKLTLSVLPQSQTLVTDFGSGGVQLPNGQLAPELVNPELVRRLSQIAEGSGYRGDRYVTSVRDDTQSTRVQPRGDITDVAQAVGGYVYYSGEFPEIRLSYDNTEHQLIKQDSVTGLQTVRNGVSGAIEVDGVVLFSPWDYRQWLPDLSGQRLREPDTQSQDYEDEEQDTELSQILTGIPDTDVGQPTKLIESGGISYRSNVEIDNFPNAARSPGAIAYSENSSNAFTKTRYTKLLQSGVSLGEVNAEVWSWDLTSNSPSSGGNNHYYFIPTPTEDLSTLEEPQWIYNPVNYQNAWRKVKEYNRIVRLDGEGYKELDDEIGTMGIRVRSETQKEAAELLAEAITFEYEETRERQLNGDTPEADELAKQAAEKRVEAALYELRMVPYRKRTRYFYRNYSEDIPVPGETTNPSPCTLDEKEGDEPQEPAARYLYREITEEDTLLVVENPVQGEPPIISGNKTETIKQTILDNENGWYTITTQKTLNPDGTTGSETVSKSDFTERPSPAQRVAQQQTRRSKPKREQGTTDGGFIQYFSTPNPIPFNQSNKQSVSIPKVRFIDDAQIALRELARQENINAEQVAVNCRYYRSIQEGDKVLFNGQCWQANSLSQTGIFSLGLVQCRDNIWQLGSYLNIELNQEGSFSCAV